MRGDLRFSSLCDWRLWLVLDLLWVYSNAQCQPTWRQGEFIIGTYSDPPIDFRTKNFDKDVASLSLARDANYNLLSGTQGFGGLDHSFEGMQYALRVAHAAGLYYMVTDSRVYERRDKAEYGDVSMSVARDYMSTPSQIRTTQYGYNLCDEPKFLQEEMQSILALKTQLEFSDPEKLIFMNLAPSYAVDECWGGFDSGNRDGVLQPNERAQYEAYLNFYADTLRLSVIAFDHYPFLKDGAIRHDYFYNLEVMRKKAGERPLWAFPMTIGHHDYVDPDEHHMNFMYFCPIAYGAKGLITFAFWAMPQEGYRSALFDRDGTRTFRYSVVKRLNGYVKLILGPVLMRSKWTGVYHADVFDTSQMGIDTVQNRMASSRLHIANRHVLVGTFRNKKELHLFIVNKSLTSIHNVSVVVKTQATDVFAAPRVVDFSPGSLKFKKLVAKSDSRMGMLSFTIDEFIGGEGRMFRLSR